MRYFGFGEFSGERFLVHRGLVFGVIRETLELSIESDVLHLKDVKF